MLACTGHSARYFKSRRAVPGRCWNVHGTAQYIAGSHVRFHKKPTQVARNAMMSIFRTLLLAFAVMASVPAPGPADSDAAGRTTRFVYAHCTSTGKLSSRGLFLNRAAVRRHIAASKHCRDAEEGIRTIQVEALAGDDMAGAGGAAGPAPDIRHQPAGDVHPQFCIQHTNTLYKWHIPSTLVAQWY